METNPNIDSFLRGTLSHEERQQFLARMQEDTELRKEVLFQKQMMESLDDASWSFMETYPEAEVNEYASLFEGEDMQALKASIGEAKDSFRGKGRVRPLKWLAYAAAASLVIWLGSTFFKKNPLSPEELYVQNLDLEGLPSLVVRDSGQEEYLVAAQLEFENKNYEAALPTFKSTLDTTQRTTSALYLYTGISQMELGRYPEAETTFTQLEQSDLVDANKALWYRALLYLKQSDTEKAKVLLERIAQMNLQPYTGKAQQLLRELD
ncbi:MAG: tetratricopeptide repeat protein [Flavobacteriaceae bacterium]|nr:tetratricopeptide repeat protein [Flavobacteriaceae bacterium]